MLPMTNKPFPSNQLNMIGQITNRVIIITNDIAVLSSVLKIVENRETVKCDFLGTVVKTVII